MEIQKIPLASTSEAVNQKSVIPRIVFSDGSTFYVKREWIDKYKILNEDVIFASSKCFQKYILPLLNNDRILISDSDEKYKLHEIMREIEKYDLKLTISQEYDIANNCGFVVMLTEIHDYIVEHKKKPEFLKKNYYKRIDSFVNQWNSYVLMFVHVNPEKEYLKRLDGADLLSYIKDDKINELVHLTFMYDNFIYTYCEWFKKIVIEKHNIKEMMDFSVKLSLDASGIIAPISNVIDTVANIFNGFGNLIPSNIKEGAIDKVKRVVNLNELLTAKK